MQGRGGIGFIMTKRLSLIFGVVFFMIAGAAAFQDQELLWGMFAADRAVNTIHLTSGILGVLAGIAGTYYARLYLWTVGLLYLAASVAGFIAGNVMGVDLDQADNFLNLALAAVALYTVFAEDPHLRGQTIPITGRRGVTDFRQPAHR